MEVGDNCLGDFVWIAMLCNTVLASMLLEYGAWLVLVKVSHLPSPLHKTCEGQRYRL